MAKTGAGSAVSHGRVPAIRIEIRIEIRIKIRIEIRIESRRC